MVRNDKRSPAGWERLEKNCRIQEVKCLYLAFKVVLIVNVNEHLRNKILQIFPQFLHFRA